MTSKISNISILLSFVGLWLISFIKNDVQIIVGFFLIFTFGIAHGANDISIIKKINTAKTISSQSLLLSYVAIVLITALFFTYIPWLALLLFIIVSSYHFGEQHWEKKSIVKNKYIATLFYTIYGAFVLLLLFQFHQADVLKIVSEITGVNLNYVNIPLLFQITSVLLIILFKINYFTSKTFQKNIASELLYLLVLAIIFKVGSLIWAFTIYFVFWHSIPSIFDQIAFLYGAVSFSNFKAYLKSAFLYWLISIVGITVLYLLLKDFKIFDSIFFSFLAAITFPHILVIEKMFVITNKKTEP